MKATHIIPRKGKWAIRRDGSKTITVSTKAEAIAAAKTHDGIIYVFGTDGRIAERIAA